MNLNELSQCYQSNTLSKTAIYSIQKSMQFFEPHIKSSFQCMLSREKICSVYVYKYIDPIIYHQSFYSNSLISISFVSIMQCCIICIYTIAIGQESLEHIFMNALIMAILSVCFVSTYYHA